MDAFHRNRGSIVAAGALLLGLCLVLFCGIDIARDANVSNSSVPASSGGDAVQSDDASSIDTPRKHIDEEDIESVEIYKRDIKTTLTLNQSSSAQVVSVILKLDASCETKPFEEAGYAEVGAKPFLFKIYLSDGTTIDVGSSGDDGIFDELYYTSNDYDTCQELIALHSTILDEVE